MGGTNEGSGRCSNRGWGGEDSGGRNRSRGERGCAHFLTDRAVGVMGKRIVAVVRVVGVVTAVGNGGEVLAVTATGCDEVGLLDVASALNALTICGCKVLFE